jgi:hypothetical protein
MFLGTCLISFCFLNSVLNFAIDSTFRSDGFSEVWDNCGVGNSNKLDQLQLEAARIVTGLLIFASSILIYKELGWE